MPLIHPGFIVGHFPWYAAFHALAHNFSSTFLPFPLKSVFSPSLPLPFNCLILYRLEFSVDVHSVTYAAIDKLVLRGLHPVHSSSGIYSAVCIFF